MGIYIIRVPDIGEGIAEVELAAWHVAPGQPVQEDQSVADVMTDKATVEIPSPVSGKVLALGGAVGQMLAVGAELIRLEVEGAGNLPAASEPEPEPQRSCRIADCYELLQKTDKDRRVDVKKNDDKFLYDYAQM